MSARSTIGLLRSALLLGAAVLPCSAQAQVAVPSAPRTATAEARPVQFTERTLANGLRVFAIPDKTTTNVSVQVWYDVGSKDDPTGRSGFAHLFEHLMFKATRNLVPEQMDRLTEDVGGYNNASTGDDYTNYYEVIPANHLQRLLFAEADRMASLVVEPSTFASERDVVKEELRQNTLARPYGKLFSLYYPAAVFRRHPYARGTIGSIDNLDSATIDDVRAFHATFYRPDNAVLVVSGNFDAAQLDRWVDQYFAGIKRPASAIPRVTVTEPRRTTPVTYTVHEPNTPLPAVMIAWPVPADRDADTPALSVLNAILSAGESSRLYESLVYRDQLAQSADSFLDSKKDAGNLATFAILAGGKSVADGEAALRREVARLRDAPPSAAELNEAKNQILTAAIRQAETAEGKASTLAQSVIVDGDPRATERQVAETARVTAADIQRVARKYLGEEAAVTIRYLPADGAKGGTGDPIAVAASVVTRPVASAAGVEIVQPASAAQRVAPPAPAAPLAANLPRPNEVRLANGLRVITVERHDLPLVTAQLVALGGGATDREGRAGTSSLAAELLTKGTTTRSATEIARAVEALGGAIGAAAGSDDATVSLTVKSDQIAPAMTILADVAQHPAFAPAEIERARAQSLDAVTLAVKDPRRLAGLVAARTVLGDAAYAAPLSGTPTSLKAITRDDLVGAYARTWRPDNAALVMVGDITPAAAQRLAEQGLGKWTGAAAAALPAEPQAVPAPRVVVVDMPEAAQAGVVVARPGLARSDPSYYAATVANTVLGGGFSSRLNQEIRIKRGLSYGAASSLAARRRSGLVAAGTSTKNASVPQVVELIVAEMARLGREPAPTTAEIDTRKAVLVGGFGREIETTDGIAGILADYVTQGVPLTELDQVAGRIEGVDAAHLVGAARAVLDPAAASIVVVGDAKQFVDVLRKRYPKLEVIPATSLSLDTPTLQR